MKITSIHGESLHKLSSYINNLRNYNKIFRKGVTYDKIKSQKNQGFTLFR